MGVTYGSSEIPASFASCRFMSPNSGNLADRMKSIRKAELEGYGLQDSDTDAVLRTAARVQGLANELGLKIMMLQPFARFEGWLRSSSEKRDAFDRAERWFKVMEAVGTDMLRFGSSDAEGISSNFDEHAADLAELADLAAARGLRIAYENWCWATHALTWKEVWQIVKKADRSNLGLCLDTFQSAGGELGDPTTESGYIKAVNKQVLKAR